MHKFLKFEVYFCKFFIFSKINPRSTHFIFETTFLDKQQKIKNYDQFKANTSHEKNKNQHNNLDKLHTRLLLT